MLKQISKTLAAAVLAVSLPLSAAEDSATAEAQAQARAAAMMSYPYAVRPEPPIYMQAEGYDWDHEIYVVLPRSYHVETDKTYPVLWITDGAFHLPMLNSLATYYSFSQIPEIILVSVGHRHTEPMSEFMRKRTVDLFYSDSELFTGPALDAMKATMGDDPNAIFRQSRGDEFFDFLVDDVRPALMKKYRMADDHALFGHSAGGAFTSRAVFQRPGAFKRFIIGSGTDAYALQKEEEYAKKHTDMDARIFLAAGDLEPGDVFGSSQRLASNPLLLAENLRLRQYPSLGLEIRLYRDRDHSTVTPLTLTDGLLFIYKDLMEASK